MDAEAHVICVAKVIGVLHKKVKYVNLIWLYWQYSWLGGARWFKFRALQDLGLKLNERTV